MLAAARRCLSPDGLLMVVTPDIGSLAARLMKHRWWHFRPAHIGYFSRKTMRMALRQAGFTVECVQPYQWWFTIGYVLTRLQRYLPIGLLNRWCRTRFEHLWDLPVPVNLRDSFIYFAYIRNKI